MQIGRILVFDDKFLSGNTLLQQVVPALKTAFPGIPVGGGTDAYFAELNRNPPDGGLLDFINFSICPQVHAFDKLTLLENLEAQPHVVESARALLRKPVSIGAISLKQRFNAVATDGNTESSLPETDPRQHTLFSAGWTLGSLRHLAMAGATSLNYYETVGPRGILPRHGGSHGPSPLLHLFQELEGADLPEILSTESSHPLEIDAICLKHVEETKLLIANLGESGIPVLLEGMENRPETCCILREKGWEAIDVNNISEHRITLEANSLYKIIYTI